MRSTFAAPAAVVALFVTAAPAGAAVHTIAQGETLSGIAAVNGMSPATLAAANGLSPDALVVAGRSLQIPAAGTVAAAAPATSSAPVPAAVAAAPVGGGGGHLVTAGETLSGIAAANGLSTAALAAANGVSPTSFVISGTRLKVPPPGTTAPAAGTAAPAGSPATGSAAGTGGGGSTGGHVVQPGEALSGIAAANGLSTAALAAANGLSPTSYVLAGTRMRIPARSAATAAAPAAASPASAPAPPPMGGYTVRPGDTLSALAARSRVPAAQIAYANGLSPTSWLISGRVLKLPTGSPAITASAPTPAAPTPVAPAAPPIPTGTRVTASTVGSIAARNGVPSSLASAIAWQESGFNNSMVSSANARGVMQVMPGTWDWVQSALAGGRRLNPVSATDNVQAGTLYLRHLLQQTGGDPAMTAAAYYQGLSSVRRIGMLPDTRRYVANVLALRGRFGG